MLAWRQPYSQLRSTPTIVNMAPSDITLYTTRTPNGIKASIALAELGLEYKVRVASHCISQITES